MAAFKVERVEAVKFSQVWNKGGIAIILSPEALDFATAFANVVLNNFVQMCQAQAQAAQKAAEPKKLIIEG
jgi:hypothetical protein